MRNRRYLQFTHLSEWDDDSIVLVHILSGGKAKVRVRPESEQSPELTLGQALEEAHFSLNLPIREQVAVYLDEGAVWDDRYGELVRHEA